MFEASDLERAERAVLRAAEEWGRNLTRFGVATVCTDQPSLSLSLALGEWDAAKEAAEIEGRLARRKADQAKTNEGA